MGCSEFSCRAHCQTPASVMRARKTRPWSPDEAFERVREEPKVALHANPAVPAQARPATNRSPLASTPMRSMTSVPFADVTVLPWDHVPLGWVQAMKPSRLLVVELVSRGSKSSSRLIQPVNVPATTMRSPLRARSYGMSSPKPAAVRAQPVLSTPSSATAAGSQRLTVSRPTKSRATRRIFCIGTFSVSRVVPTRAKG